MPEQKVEAEPRNASTDSAIAVLLLTAVSYAAAFSYERGYTHYFGVPATLVDVEIKSLLLCGAALLGVFLVLPILQFVIRLWPTFLPQPVQRRLAGVVAIAVILLVALLLVRADRPLWIFAIAVLVYVLVDELLWPATRNRKAGSYSQRIAIADQDRLAKRHVLDVIGNRIGHGAVMVVILCVFSVGLSFMAGVGEARHQTEFLAPIGDDCIVIRKYGEILICVGIDESERKAQGAIKLLPISDAALALERQSIGYLKAYDDHRPAEAD